MKKQDEEKEIFAFVSDYLNSAQKLAAEDEFEKALGELKTGLSKIYTAEECEGQLKIEDIRDTRHQIRLLYHHRLQTLLGRLSVLSQKEITSDTIKKVEEELKNLKNRAEQVDRNYN